MECDPREPEPYDEEPYVDDPYIDSPKEVDPKSSSSSHPPNSSSSPQLARMRSTPASRRFQSMSSSGISSRNWLGIMSLACPHWARTAARVTYSRRFARVMPTYARRRSSDSSLVSSMARWCGNVPCSIPVRNTYGYSKPLAVCKVIIVTLPESSPSPGN